MYLAYIGDKFGSGNGIWKQVPMVGSIVATEKSPLFKLRAIAHKANFYPLVDFVHLCYLHIINFLIPLSSLSLFNRHRTAEFFYKSLSLPRALAFPPPH